MSTKIENLKDLFIEQGRELYNASRQEEKELPNIQKASTNSRLSLLIDRKINLSKEQKDRLHQVFNKLGQRPEGETSECCKAVLKQANSLIARSTDPEIKDAAIITAVQRLNHAKITGLGTLTSYAKEIGENEIANSLHEALVQEKVIDSELSELAEQRINKSAVTAIAL